MKDIGPIRAVVGRKVSYPGARMARMLEDVRQLNQGAVKAAAADSWLLSDGELVDCLRAAHRLVQVGVVLQAGLVREAQGRGLPASQGYRGTAPWLQQLLLLDSRPARELVSHATTLVQQPRLRQEILDGHVSVRQAEAIAETVTAIPAGLADLEQVSLAETTHIAEQAEDRLIEMAGTLSAHQLTKVGERILTHVAPHLAEQADAAALEREEARAHAGRGFTLSPARDGTVRLSGRLGLEDAAIVQAALHPLCTPTAGDERTAPQRRADALVDICRLALRTRELPVDGGEPPQVNVTVAYDPLTRELGLGSTDTGARFSPATVRRMACDAKILPVVLSGAGQILDLGRSRRLATGALRRALMIRDGGCAFPGCDRPPRWTDAHHVIEWAAGGQTDVDNCVLLCGVHHRLIHSDAGWSIRMGPDRRPEFIPPPDVDPLQQPRRNLYHQRQ